MSLPWGWEREASGEGFECRRHVGDERVANVRAILPALIVGWFLTRWRVILLPGSRDFLGIAGWLFQ
jgi:hypothetical protein